MKTHDGSCHCGAFKFSVELDIGKGAMTCNCSMCQRAGYVMMFVPRDKVTVKTDESMLKSYHFNTKKLDHLFCTTCGIHPITRGQMPDGTPMVMVNLRCLEGLDDLSAIQTSQHNGRAA